MTDEHDFEARCRARHAAGLRHYRGGDPSEPFVGDPLAEALDELADCRNYVTEALEAGQLSPLAAEHVEDLARKAYGILSTLGKGAGDE